MGKNLEARQMVIDGVKEKKVFLKVACGR